MDEEMKKEIQESIQKTVGDSVKENLPEVVKEAVGEQLKETVKSEVDEAVKALGLDKMDKSFPGLPTGKSDEKTAKERALKFFKAVFSKDRKALDEMGVEFKTMTEGSDGAGGFLVPEEVMSMLDRVADDYGIIRKLSRKLPMGRDILNVPVVGTKPSVTWPGEGGAGTASQPVIQNVKLEARTAMGLTPVSNELMADANLSVVDMLIELFAEELAGAEDEQGLNGVGAPFTGVLNSSEVSTSTALATHDTIAEVDLKDLSDALANIKSTVLSGCVWVFHRTVWNQLKNIQEGSQTVAAFNTIPTVSMKTEGGNLVPAGFLWGYPVYLSDKMPSSPTAGQAYGIFGNFSKFYFGDRQQVAIRTSEHATIGGTNMFETNSMAVRVLERVALSVGVGEAFNVLKLAAS